MKNCVCVYASLLEREYVTLDNVCGNYRMIIYFDCMKRKFTSFIYWFSHIYLFISCENSLLRKCWPSHRRGISGFKLENFFPDNVPSILKCLWSKQNKIPPRYFERHVSFFFFFFFGTSKFTTLISSGKF